MHHKITIADEEGTVVYEQRVENLDLVAVITAINRRQRAPRSDRGKARRREEVNATKSDS